MNFAVLTQHKPGELRKVASGANEAVKALKALRLKKYRTETGLFVAEGARTIIEALECSAVPAVIAYLASGEATQKRIINAARKAGALLLEVNEGVLAKISSRDNPQSMIGVFQQHWQDIGKLAAQKPPILLVLEEIRDPGNLGTILRTLDGFGIHDVLLVGDTVDPYSFEAVRASMGSIFAVNLYRCEKKEFSAFVRTFAGSVIGTALEGAIDIAAADWQSPLMLLMGNEQQGLSSELRPLCHQLVKIPMRGRADSFNLAVATGIALYACISAQR